MTGQGQGCWISNQNHKNVIKKKKTVNNKFLKLSIKLFKLQIQLSLNHEPYFL